MAALWSHLEGFAQRVGNAAHHGVHGEPWNRVLCGGNGPAGHSLVHGFLTAIVTHAVGPACERVDVDPRVAQCRKRDRARAPRRVSAEHERPLHNVLVALQSTG